MKKIFPAFLFLLFLLSACGATNNSNKAKSDLKSEQTEENRANITLLQRIREKSGIIITNNVPRINGANNSFNSAGNQEPLYLVNNQVIGNSFASVNQIVDSYAVKSIKILKRADASSYGTQGANGVILITLY